MRSTTRTLPAASALDSARTAEESFRVQLSTLYALSQQSDHLFASPLGPVFQLFRHAYVPRFVFFGPHASEDSWRLAFLAGFDHRDLRASRAVTGLTRHLAENAEEGHGLDLSFFPLVDAGGLFLGTGPRALAAEPWGRSTEPEIDLLAKDAQLRGYHGFVRIETAAPGEDSIVVTVRHPESPLSTPDLELISTVETEPFSVRFECAPQSALVRLGPLALADDLPVQPFELALRIPTAWSDDAWQEAVTRILTRFIRRYRAFQAFGQHL